MNFLLLLITIVAIASIIPILKSSLRWEAILGVGLLITATAGIVLLLDYLTPLVSFESVGDQTVTGLPLYLPGRTTSILGTGYGFFVIAFCWGIALIAVGLIKRSKKAAAEKEAGKPVEEPNEISEEQRILEELEKELESLRNNLDDPGHAGTEDAIRAGGPFPKQSDKEPLAGGYEAQIRNRFEALGAKFAQTTVSDLKTNILNALRSLEEIKNAIVARSYKELARTKYSENNVAIVPNTIQKKQANLAKTTQNRDAFIDSLKLRPAELPHWADDDKTSLEALLVWGGVFALLEFIISWFFLKDDIGAETIKIAGFAVVIIFILSFLAGFLFRFMRRNQAFHIRIPAIVGYLCVGAFIFLGLGLLLNYREFTNNAGIDAITDGYGSLLSNLTNLVVFLINLLALAIFYWKVLHFFNKFYGYNQVDKPFNRAEKQWDSMFEEVQEGVSKALAHADEEASTNSEKAKKHFADIQEGTTVLKNIKAILSNAYASTLRPAYNDDVTTYRDNNCKRRVLRANPVPAYFNEGYFFCDAEQHFTRVEDSNTFFADNQEELNQAQENNKIISAGQTQWNTDRTALSNELDLEFKAIIDNARAAAA